MNEIMADLMPRMKRLRESGPEERWIDEFFQRCYDPNEAYCVSVFAEAQLGKPFTAALLLFAASSFEEHPDWKADDVNLEQIYGYAGDLLFEEGRCSGAESLFRKAVAASTTPEDRWTNTVGLAASAKQAGSWSAAAAAFAWAVEHASYANPDHRLFGLGVKDTWPPDRLSKGAAECSRMARTSEKQVSQSSCGDQISSSEDHVPIVRELVRRYNDATSAHNRFPLADAIAGLLPYVHNRNISVASFLKIDFAMEVLINGSCIHDELYRAYLGGGGKASDMFCGKTAKADAHYFQRYLYGQAAEKFFAENQDILQNKEETWLCIRDNRSLLANSVRVFLLAMLTEVRRPNLFRSLELISAEERDHLVPYIQDDVDTILSYSSPKA